MNAFGSGGREDSIHLDFEQNAEVLKELRIENQLINITVINSLKHLVNLRSLSLSKCNFHPQEKQRCIAELGLLTTLRTLNLSHMDLEFDDPILYNMQENLSNLDNLNISMSTIGSVDLQKIMNISIKKWKTLGIYGVVNVPKIGALADKVFAKFLPPTIESLVNNAEYYSKDPFSAEPFWAFDLMRYFSILKIPSDQVSRVENILLDAFGDYAFNRKFSDISTISNRPEFILKIVSLLYSARIAFRQMGYRPYMEKQHVLLGVDRFYMLSDLYLCPIIDRFTEKLIKQNLNKKIVEIISGEVKKNIEQLREALVKKI